MPSDMQFTTVSLERNKTMDEWLIDFYDYIKEHPTEAIDTALCGYKQTRVVKDMNKFYEDFGKFLAVNGEEMHFKIVEQDYTLLKGDYNPDEEVYTFDFGEED